MVHRPIYSSSKHFASKLQESFLRNWNTSFLLDFLIPSLTFTPAIRCYATPGAPPRLCPFLAMLAAHLRRRHIRPISLCLISHNRLHWSIDLVVTFHVRTAGADDHLGERDRVPCRGRTWATWIPSWLSCRTRCTSCS